MAHNCAFCQYFEDTENGVGLCKRNPPTILLDDETTAIFEVTGEYFGRWPLVAKNMWCGEYKDSGKKFVEDLQKAIQHRKNRVSS